jgi:putative membrane protein
MGGASSAAPTSMAGDRATMPASMAAMPADMTPTTRAAYVPMAAASDLFEIQSSQLALTQAQKPAVRQFARMMIDHHTRTTAQLTAAATRAGVPPQPALMPMQTEMLNQLQTAGQTDFDRVYIQQQTQAHEMALALHKNYARKGDTAALRRVASTAVPIVQRHLTRARQLSRSL